MLDYLRMGAILMVVAILATGILAYTEQVTREPIATAKRQEFMRALNQVLPPGYDNQPDQDSIQVVDRSLNRKEKPVTFYRARKGAEDLGVAFMVTAPDGYSGNIDVMMGVTAAGAVVAIQVVAHAETPGLGDKIVITDWPAAFKGKTLEGTKWAVKKDGGEFDQFAGATITPRAVVNAVHRGLKYFVENQSRILARSGS
ncbi:MAG: electron transport complex subunit RsxG [Magnetococcus sp. WYHC-3]